ncbi:MAG: phospho-sugar mutase, partial [Actinomycetota bacterium]
EARARVMAGAVALDPAEVAGIAVANREDLAEGRHLPPTAGVVLDLADGSRVIVRPSGTEPKIKAYLEVVAESVEAAEIDVVRDATNRRLADLAAAIEALLLQPAG